MNRGNNNKGSLKMISYLKLIRVSLFKAYIASTVIFYLALIIMLVILAIAKNDIEEFLSPQAFGYSGLLSAALSVFIIMFGFFAGYIEFRMQQSLFDKMHFVKTRFVKIQLLKNSLWSLHKEVYATTIEGFYVVADMYTKGKLSFAILSSRDLSINFQTPGKLREIEIFPESTGVTVVIPVDSFWTPSEKDLDELLATLAFTMKKHGYNPATDFKLYERKLKKEILMKGLTSGVG